MNWEEFRAKLKLTGELTVEKKVWAFIRPDGSFLIDSSFQDEKHAFEIGLGWPSQEEIEDAKAKGYRAQHVTVVF